jgi:hypothetical protein
VLAIDEPIPDSVTTAKALLARMSGHVLARGVLTGTYERLEEKFRALTIPRIGADRAAALVAAVAAPELDLRQLANSCRQSDKFVE